MGCSLSLAAVMSLSDVVTVPGRRDGAWWIGPSCEEDTFQLVFSMAVWADKDVALVIVPGQRMVQLRVLPSARESPGAWTSLVMGWSRDLQTQHLPFVQPALLHICRVWYIWDAAVASSTA